MYKKSVGESYIFKDNFFIKKKLPLLNKKTLFRFFLFLFIELIILITSLLIGFYFYHLDQIEIEKNIHINHLKLSPDILNQDFKTIIDDLTMLSDEDYLKQYLNNSNTVNLDDLYDRLEFFVESKRLYYRLRFIDNQGLEKIRISYKNGKLENRENIVLQNKSDRYYFHQIQKMDKGDIYVSSLDYNEEFGRIEIPKNLTMRFGIPLFSNYNERKGMLLLNYNLQDVILDFKNTFKTSEYDEFSFLRNDSQYIASNKPKNDLLSQHSYKSEFPIFWDIINEQEEYQQLVDNKIQTSYSFYPLLETSKTIRPYNRQIKFIGPDGNALLRKVIVITTSKKTFEYNFFKYQTTFHYLIYFFIQLFIMLIMWIIIGGSTIKEFTNHWMEALFQGIEKSPSSVIYTNADGDILYTNEKFQKLSSYTFEEIFEKNPRLIKSGKMSDSSYKEMWKSISSGKTWSGELQNKRKDGELYWVYTSISPIFDSRGKLANYLGIQEDISENKRLSEELKTLASTDPLTGIRNRRSFFQNMEKEVERSKRGNHSLSILMIDIDNFKRVNDSYGHQIGDMILKDIAKIITKNSRKIDLYARYGGEEFIISLPETDLKEAAILGERLRIDIENHECQFEGKKYQVTISVGIAQWNRELDLYKVIKEADKLLYKAKDNGRNRIEY